MLADNIILIMDKIINSHLKYSKERGYEKTYCPSEVARHLFPNDWRNKMMLVRKVADTLVEKGEIVVLQKGIVQTKLPSCLKGPIRLRINIKS